MSGRVGQRSGFAKKACRLANAMFVQEMAQAPYRHLQNLGGSCLIAARTLKRPNDVVLLELREVRFKVNSVIRQIEIGYNARFESEYSLG